MKSYTVGARSVLPLVPGVVPFALIYSITAAGIGLDISQS
jgi:predicted branched-subunit amino acid permease